MLRASVVRARCGGANDTLSWGKLIGWMEDLRLDEDDPTAGQLHERAQESRSNWAAQQRIRRTSGLSRARSRSCQIPCETQLERKVCRHVMTLEEARATIRLFKNTQG
jgi:hypothetical protein